MQHTLANNSKYLRTPQAADYIGWAYSTLTKKRCTGEDAPPYIKMGRTVVYSQDDLDAWMAKNRRASTSVAA